MEDKKFRWEVCDFRRLGELAVEAVERDWWHAATTYLTAAAMIREMDNGDVSHVRVFVRVS